MPFVFIPTFRLKGSRGSSSKRSQHTSRISVISDSSSFTHKAMSQMTSASWQLPWRCNQQDSPIVDGDVSPSGKMCWTYLKISEHSLKTLVPSQKTFRPPHGDPSWLRACGDGTFDDIGNSWFLPIWEVAVVGTYGIITSLFQYTKHCMLCCGNRLIISNALTVQ